MASIVIPGQPLGPAGSSIPGPGVHLFDNQLTSSLVGQVHNDTSTNPPTISVIKPVLSEDEEQGNTTLLPEVNSEVICRVTRINARQATVGIFVVNGKLCGDEFQGVIRVQDVRLTEVDKVKIFTSFRPGDIVRARVVSKLVCLDMSRAHKLMSRALDISRRSVKLLLVHGA